MINHFEFIGYMFILTIVFSFIWLYFLSLYNSLRYWVPQVCTFGSDFKVLKAFFLKNKKIKLKWKNIIDLWSWTWRVSRFFEKEFKMNTTWYEIDLLNYIISVILKIIFWNNTKLIKWNYFNADLSKYDFIYVYLFPQLMKKIETKIWSNCKTWTIIISNAFKFKEHKPFKILLWENNKEEVYLYKI